ncbi:MAG: TonB-dependent siderophore receptor [Nostoc sp.]|uniref:TonB-dependent siderophore receptor n=1 Tax=Nostoc sp. TaxID=1180 RepID=UPI002FFCB193
MYGVMKVLRSLFISCFVVAVVIQPIQAKEVTEIQSIQELDRSARTVKEWFAQIEQQNPPAQSQEGEVVQVTSVEANPTSSGVEVILQTDKGQQLQIVNRSFGNNFIADIPNAQLHLPSGEAFIFRSTKPIAGVSEITVTNFDANTIRVNVTGEAGVPIVELFDSPDEGIIFSVATAASRAQQPQTQPTQPQEQPGSQTQPSLPSPASNEPIELVVTGEQDQGYNPSQTSVGTLTDTPLRDIPNTIQIVPQQVIKDRNVTDVNSALENVSGVQQSFGNITIRGFNAQRTSNSGLLSGGGDFSNVEQVEVLRGPAAVLFGNGGLGGIINVTTKQPLFEPFYELGLNVGSDSFYRGTADLSGPLTQNRNLRYRLNIALQDAYDSQDLLSSQSLFVAPTLAWDISDDTKLTVNFEYLSQPSKSYGVQGLNGLFLPRPIDNDYFDDRDTYDSSIQGGYLFEHRFNKNLQLRNSLAFSSAPGHGRGISYGSLSDDGFIGRSYSDDRYVYETYSTQTDLLANFNIGSVAHQVLFGFNANLNRQRFFGLSVDELSPLDISNPDYDIELPSSDAPINYNQQYNNDSYGVFLQDQIKFLDNLILVVAGRYDWVTVKASDYVGGTADINPVGAFSPRIGIVYQPIKPLSLYANYSRSLDTADTGGRSRTGQAFDPQRSTQYEAGIKSDFLDGKLSAVLAAYQITRTNVLTPDPLNTEDESFSIQIGEQRSRGIDFTLTGEILPGWNLTAGYSYIDAIITKDNNYEVGSPVVFTPHNSVNLWTTYRIQSGDLQGLGFGLGIYFVDERPGGEFIARDYPDYKIPTYTRFDAALFYRRNNWEAALNFENLFDSEYIVNSRGPGDITLGAPFTIRGSLRVRF